MKPSKVAIDHISTRLMIADPVGRERKSRKSTTTRISRESESAVAAGTGRPDRSTGVNQRAQAGAVDRPVDRIREQSTAQSTD